MNIVTKCTLLLTATLVTGLISFQSHASAFGDSGKYAMVTSGEKGEVIWILNTETGDVRICAAVWPKPQCGQWLKKE